MAAALFVSWSSSGPQQQLAYPADPRIDADALEYPAVASAKAGVLSTWGARARALAAATATAAAAAAPPPGVGAIAAQHEEWCRALSVLAVGLLLKAKSAGAAEATWRHAAGHGCADGAYNLAQFWRNTPARRSAENEMSAMYRRSNALARPPERRNATSAVRRQNMAQASIVSLRFAADQLEHLLRTGAALPPPPPGHSYESQVVAYRDIIARIPDDDPEGFQLTLAPADAARVPSYRTALYIEDKPRTDQHHRHRHGSSSSPADDDPAGAPPPPPPYAVAAMAPRSAADIAEVQRAYREESVVHLDGVLTPAALQALWEFSSRSTIYYEDKPRYSSRLTF
jgi:hypothetical protein